MIPLLKLRFFRMQVIVLLLLLLSFLDLCIGQFPGLAKTPNQFGLVIIEVHLISGFWVCQGGFCGKSGISPIQKEKGRLTSRLLRAYSVCKEYVC